MKLGRKTELKLHCNFGAHKGEGKEGLPGT
jgi:hypothetical protein